MTEKTTPVAVEWALEGKMLGRGGNQVLACSDGRLSRENFTELIGRFSIGTPDELPQVSVSFLTSGSPPDRAYYLGMAIHKWAADMHTEGGDLLEGDDDHRPVFVTAYFCVPYQPLAAARVSYQAMYEEFGSIRLGTSGGQPLPVEFPLLTGLPALDGLVMQSAGRLLTGRPVCVLGAESATVAERLAFIGAVAALLPYGFRTRLTAATWVRSTQRGHRFRLFFSDARRDDSPDDVVYWGRPERTALTPGDDYAYVYGRWLLGTVGKLETLARLGEPRSFSSEDVLQALDDIGLRSAETDETRRGQRKPEEKKPEEPAPRPPAPSPVPAGAKTEREQRLRDCARFMRGDRLPQLNTAITRLASGARSISPEERRRCREIIKEERLFRHDSIIGGYEAELRQVLFKVAFPQPLSYEDYCLIENSVDLGFPGTVDLKPLDIALIRMIANMKMSDIRIRIVVYAQMGEADRRKIDSWYASHKVNEFDLIDAATGEWQRPRHAFYATVIAGDYMNHRQCDTLPVRHKLQHYGYLARLLQQVAKGYHKHQVNTLTSFLKAAYPQGLGAGEIRQVLLESREPPSRALLAAVLLWLTYPEDAQLARETFVLRLVATLDLEPQTLNALEPRLGLARPGGSAVTREYPSGRGPGMNRAGA